MLILRVYLLIFLFFYFLLIVLHQKVISIFLYEIDYFKNLSSHVFSTLVDLTQDDQSVD